MKSEQRSRLLYRRQYLYGPKVNGFTWWQHNTLPNGCELAVHPELEYTRVDDGPRTLAMLGYMLDPLHPQADNRQVLRGLLQKFATCEELIATLDNVSGRYVLFIFSGMEQYVLMDAAGLRQVFHYQDENGSMWLCAQPGLLQQVIMLSYSEEAQVFLNSPVIRSSHEPWWPGTSTPFSNVKHLLPNHLLDLVSGEVRRYWPNAPITRFGLREGAEKSAALLRGIMAAANHRFHLAMALTGGYDSRIVFAACREIMADLHIYSMIYHKLTTESSDIKVAAQLAQYVGKPHQVFTCDEPMDDDFEYLYPHNLEKSYQSYGHIVYGRFKNLDQRLVVVKSVVNEIARCFYYRTGIYPYRVTADLLCRLSKLGVHPFSERYFAEWLDDALVVEKYGYKLLDFFYWENRNANWQAMSQLEFDLAHDEFTPFNQRELLATMLGVDYRQRCMPKNEFQRELVRCNWPEMDTFPYNPTSRVLKKPLYEGPWMVPARWLKYHLLKRSTK